MMKEQKLHILTFDTIDSTNSYARREIEAGRMECPCLIFAREQTAGRGRHGNSFTSPKDGIYMTVVTQPEMPAERCLFLTSAAAVAAVRVLEQYTDLAPKIKWVNDIWIGDRKICGILVEAVSGGTLGYLKYAVTGIGINTFSDVNVLGKELSDSAGTLFIPAEKREEAARAIAEEFLRLSEELDDDALREEYRERSMIIGREISFEENGRHYEGKAVDLNRDGELIVECVEGRKVLSSGVVKVRPLRTV